MAKASIAVVAESPALQERARILAQELGLPLSDNGSHEAFAYRLLLTTRHLQWEDLAPDSPGPVYVDFVSGSVAYRRRHGGGRRQPLARAIGLKQGVRPRVLDATAGLGRDGFVLACLGCTVHLVERSPIVGALLRDGLERAMADPVTNPLIRDHLLLTVADSCQIMCALNDAERPDVVYLDPMYPLRRKSSLVKKEMRAIRTMVGENADAGVLLACALRCARYRVVVKRPRYALPLQGPEASLTVQSTATRFDIYLTR